MPTAGGGALRDIRWVFRVRKGAVRGTKAKGRGKMPAGAKVKKLKERRGGEWGLNHLGVAKKKITSLTSFVKNLGLLTINGLLTRGDERAKMD